MVATAAASPYKAVTRIKRCGLHRWSRRAFAWVFLIAVLLNVAFTSCSENPSPPPPRPDDGSAPQESETPSSSSASPPGSPSGAPSRHVFGPSPRMPPTIPSPRRTRHPGWDPSDGPLALRTVAVLNNPDQRWKLGVMWRQASLRQKSKHRRQAAATPAPRSPLAEDHTAETPSSPCVAEGRSRSPQQPVFVTTTTVTRLTARFSELSVEPSPGSASAGIRRRSFPGADAPRKPGRNAGVQRSSSSMPLQQAGGSGVGRARRSSFPGAERPRSGQGAARSSSSEW